jgi:predicted flap endonuclease-1-like 5' DNA nuclease
VLDEGAAPAQRNQALIDAPPAAKFEAPVHLDPPPMAGVMAGIGEVIAVAAQEEADEARSRKVEPEPKVPNADDAPEPPQTIAAEPDPTPAPPAAPISETADGEVAADDLRKIKGLGPKMLTVLHALGITSYAQIAGWTDADLDQLDTRLGAFAGRPRRDNWVEQARLLSSGDTGAYETKFGKL